MIIFNPSRSITVTPAWVTSNFRKAMMPKQLRTEKSPKNLMELFSKIWTTWAQRCRSLIVASAALEMHPWEIAMAQFAHFQLLSLSSLLIMPRPSTNDSPNKSEKHFSLVAKEILQCLSSPFLSIIKCPLPLKINTLREAIRSMDCVTEDVSANRNI